MAKRFTPILARGGLLFPSVSARGAAQKPLTGLFRSPSGVRTEAKLTQNARAMGEG
jgi:hypothetical protein